MNRKRMIAEVLMISLLAGGCAGKSAEASVEQKPAAAVTDTPAAVTASPAAEPPAVTASPAAEPAAPAETSASSAAELTLEQAKAKAIEHAGVKEADVQFIRTEQDYEHGTMMYDIEFYAENTKYEYEIEVSTGEIVSFDKETMPTAPQVTAPASSGISEDKALEIALQKAGVQRSDISRLESKTDMEHGVPVYEIEFRSGGLEYEFEIDAASGEILKYKTDRD